MHSRLVIIMIVILNDLLYTQKKEYETLRICNIVCSSKCLIAVTKAPWTWAETATIAVPCSYLGKVGMMSMVDKIGFGLIFSFRKFNSNNVNKIHLQQSFPFIFH